MAQRRGLCLVLALALLGEAFGVPLEITRLRRGYADNELDSKEKDNKPDLEPVASESRPVRQENSFDNGDSKEDDTRPSESGTTTSRTELASPLADDDSDDDDDDDDFNSPPAPSGGGTGSNIFSLLRLATSIFPSSSGANSFMRNILQRYLNNQFSQPFGTSPYFTTEFNPTLFLRRQDINENLVNIDKIQGLKPPPFQRQETEEDDVDSESEQSDENDASEESDEANNGDSNGNNNNSKDESTPKSGSKESTENNGDDNDSDYSDEPPEGDGQGGGILGILASLSGGEDGQSDLGSLLATISGIVANLSGDGFDLNALIASGIGLFVGLLSEGEENPGAVIASYLLTSLDTITGGGSKNNGAFFGTFLSKLIKGTSAGGDPDASSEENGKEPEKDSAGFFASFLMALLGEMSKGSFGSSSSSSSHPTAAEQQWR